MNEALTLFLAWAAGGILGAIFYGGLWWTVRDAIFSRHPAFWFCFSLLLRMSIGLTGFYFVSGGEWKRLLACLIGFIAARLFITWLTRAPAEAAQTYEGRLR
jgi:F1F0 ATPase subunit 2